MSATTAEPIATLLEAVHGDVVTSDDPGYEEARTVYNGMVDRHPAAIVRVADDADVARVVTAVAAEGVPLAVRGGGHSVPGYGVCDDGVVLDLGRIRNVRVAPDARTVRVGGGALLADVDHATHAYGRAVPAGFFSTTGVGGLALGGGISAYLGRRWGMTCDQLVSADVVTASGERVVASEERNEDLFWALRGGGGNFGVVTSFEFRTHPVETVVAGPVVFAPEATEGVLAFYEEFVQRAPREFGGFLGINRAPPLPFVPEERHGTPVCIVVGSWCGDPADAESLFDEIRGAGPVVAEHVESMPYPVLQQAFDPLLPPGLRQYWKADWVAEIGDAGSSWARHGLQAPNDWSTMHLYPMNGAIHDVEAGATAFGFRNARFAAVVAGAWEDPEDDEEMVKWVRDYHAATHPHSGYAGGYTNYAAPDDEARVEANFGPAWDRLTRIKARWDPANLFRANQNVVPAA